MVGHGIGVNHVNFGPKLIHSKIFQIFGGCPIAQSYLENISSLSNLYCQAQAKPASQSPVLGWDSLITEIQQTW